MHRMLAALVAAIPLLGHAGSLADVEIYDRTRGVTLPVHEHDGRLYVVGEPGHRYELRIRNHSAQRLLAVTSVDGVNVISGETAATDQRGYVLDGGDTVRVEGWRKSLAEVATFHFTTLADSYAARTGRPDDVGVIGVAVFRERRPRPRCCDHRIEQKAELEAPAPSADAASGARAQYQERLGTGHGSREASPAQYVHFQRASRQSDEIVRIYYDSRRNLLAHGVLPSKPRLVKNAPEPFPAGFAPDP